MLRTNSIVYWYGAGRNGPCENFQPTLVIPNPGTPNQSSIAGSVLPLEKAEELLSTLTGVVSAKIVAGPSGAVEGIHVLVNGEASPKQMVRVH